MKQSQTCRNKANTIWEYLQKWILRVLDQVEGYTVLFWAKLPTWIHSAEFEICGPAIADRFGFMSFQELLTWTRSFLVLYKIFLNTRNPLAFVEKVIKNFGESWIGTIIYVILTPDYIAWMEPQNLLPQFETLLVKKIPVYFLNALSDFMNRHVILQLNWNAWFCLMRIWRSLNGRGQVIALNHHRKCEWDDHNGWQGKGGGQNHLILQIAICSKLTTESGGMKLMDNPLGSHEI